MRGRAYYNVSSSVHVRQDKPPSSKSQGRGARDLRSTEDLSQLQFATWALVDCVCFYSIAKISRSILHGRHALYHTPALHVRGAELLAIDCANGLFHIAALLRKHKHADLRLQLLEPPLGQSLAKTHRLLHRAGCRRRSRCRSTASRAVFFASSAVIVDAFSSRKKQCDNKQPWRTHSEALQS